MSFLPFSPEIELTDDERKAISESSQKYLQSQVYVERELIAHISTAFTQGSVDARNRYLASLTDALKDLEAAKKVLTLIVRAYNYPEVGCKPCGAAASTAQAYLDALQEKK